MATALATQIKVVSEISAGTGSSTLSFTEAIKSLSNVSGRETEVTVVLTTVMKVQLKVRCVT